MGLAFKYELELLGRPLARMEIGALHVMGVDCRSPIWCSSFSSFLLLCLVITCNAMHSL